MIKSISVFLLCMVALVICLTAIEFVHAKYYLLSNNSPMIRVKAIFLIVSAILIMKFTLTAKGFKIFLVVYLGIWFLDYALIFMAGHGPQTVLFGKVLWYYQSLVQLSTPLPLLFFWLFDRVFLTEEKTKAG